MFTRWEERKWDNLNETMIIVINVDSLAGAVTTAGRGPCKTTSPTSRTLIGYYNEYGSREN